MSVTAVPLSPEETAVQPMRRIHWLLAVQSVVIVLLSINRLSNLTQGYVLPNQFLRWYDFNNMLLLPLASLIAFYGLKKTIEYDSPQRNGRAALWIGLTFIIGVYLLGAGYGDHEVTNYLHGRFCSGGLPMNQDLCRIVIFNDDEFSHWVFFGGYILINAALMLLQVVFPRPGRLSGRDQGLLVVNGLFIALGIFANLAFEPIELDLYVVLALAILAVLLLRRVGRQPLLVYYTTAYVVGTVATAAYKLWHG